MDFHIFFLIRKLCDHYRHNKHFILYLFKFLFLLTRIGLSCKDNYKVKNMQFFCNSFSEYSRECECGKQNYPKSVFCFYLN